MTVIITTPQSVIVKKILEGMAFYLNREIPKLLFNMRQDIRIEILNAFQASTIYNDLTTGSLRSHFGIPSGEETSRVNAIITKIANSTDIIFDKIKTVGTSFTGGFTVNIQQEGFADLISLPQAVVDQYNWLEWLLLQGDNIIVSDFAISFGNYPFSRSGDAVMIERIGAVWKVPGYASGTATDNWITRVLNNLQDPISKIIEKYIRKLE